jgi:hypothetical protein
MPPTARQFPVRIPFVEELGLELWAYQAAAPRCASTWPRPPQQLGSGARRRADDDAGRGDGHRRAQRAQQGPGPRPGRGDDRDEDQLHAPAEGELRALAKLLHKTSTLAFCEAACSNGRGELCAHATGTFKYLRGLPASGRRAQVAATQLPTTPRNEHDLVNRQDPAGLAPGGRGHGRQLPPGRDAGARAGRRPGAGAPPLPEPGPVHAHAHERRQELRPPQAIGAVMVGGTAGEVVESRTRNLPPATRGRRWRLAAVRRGRRRRPRRCCARSTPAGCRCRPTSARWACPASRPGWADDDHRAQGRRDGGRQRRQRCRGQRARPAGQGARLPRGGHCRRRRQVRLRGGRTRLRRLRRPQGSTATWRRCRRR